MPDAPEPGSGGAGDLDDLVRRLDPDRWLSSRFATDPAARADLVALYALDHELARAPRAASNPLIAEMRLVWWREVLDQIFGEQSVRAHPTARALAEVIARRGLDRAPLDDMVEGRITALDGDLAGVERAGRGAAFAAAAILDSSPASGEGVVGELGALWARLTHGRGAPPDPDLGARLDLARRESKTIPPKILPAVLHLSLAAPELAGRRPSGLNARLRLLRASLTGRL